MNTCGSRAGTLACTHGIGRLLATLIVGPVFQINSAWVYDIVAVNGMACAVVFFLLFLAVRDLNASGDNLSPLRQAFLKTAAFSDSVPTTSGCATPLEFAAVSSTTPRGGFSMTLLTPDITVDTAAALLLLADVFEQVSGE